MNLRIVYTPLVLDQVLSEGKTETEFNDLVDVVQNSVLKSVREERTKLLMECDWTQYSDSPLSAEKKAEWATYRQALRDFPDTLNFDEPFILDENSFPSKPN